MYKLFTLKLNLAITPDDWLAGYRFCSPRSQPAYYLYLYLTYLYITSGDGVDHYVDWMQFSYRWPEWTKENIKVGSRQFMGCFVYAAFLSQF